jgi:hypothetical protein
VSTARRACPVPGRGGTLSCRPEKRCEGKRAVEQRVAADEARFRCGLAAELGVRRTDADSDSSMTLGSRAAVAQLLLPAWFINFLVFCLAAQMLGGDALNGRAEAGRYFLADHGALTQVGKGTWLYSRIHVYGLWLHTAIMLVALLIARRERHVYTASWLVPIVAGGIVALASMEFLKAAPGPAGGTAVLAGLAIGSGLAMGIWLTLWLRGRSAQV